MNAKAEAETIRSRLTLLDFSEHAQEKSLSKVPLSTGYHPKQNRLLNALPAEEFNRLSANLRLIPMPRGKVVYECGAESKYVYFPLANCIVSMIYEMENGACAETAAIGNEGMVGVTSFMGGGTNFCRAIVHNEGHAFQLAIDTLNNEFSRLTNLQRLLWRYTHALIRQMSQTAVCNRHHSVEKQLCRFLLSSVDRLSTNELFMTQELIASMMGVRRECVTGAAGKLHARGYISYRRGRIMVLDRQGLESHVCECYAAVKKEYDRLLPVSATLNNKPIAGKATGLCVSHH
ncbi:MAG: Crp/Fnr family transcriptional regulator [Sulfuricaulis sp.]